MALTGSFQTSWKGYTYRIIWNGVQNIPQNKTTITCTHQLVCGQTWSLYIGQRTLTCTVASSTKSVACNAINTSGNTTISLGTTTHEVVHISEGNASFSFSSSFPLKATISGTYKEVINVTGNATLNQIPRVSTMSFSDFTMGQSGTININKASSSFTHTITYSFGSKSGTIATKTTDSTVIWTPLASSLAEEIPNSLWGSGMFTLITYSGNSEIGRNSYSFACYVPNTAYPAINSFTLTPKTINGKNILVKDRNSLTLDCSCSGSYGSTIKNITYSGPGVTSASYTPCTVQSVPNSGTLTYTLKVTDSRGRVSTLNKTITCYDCVSPKFKSFKVYRDSNNNIKCDYEASYSSVNDTNKVTITFYYKKGNGKFVASSNKPTDAEFTGYTILSNAADSTYTVYAEVKDAYNGTGKSSSSTVFGQARIINITKDGTGIGIGKTAESNNLVDITQKVVSRSGFSLKKNIDGECVIFGAYNLMTYDSGRSGTFTMGKDASNFGYIEIFYGDSTNATRCFAKVHNPNSKYVMLMCPKTDGTVKFSKWQIQSDQMIPDASINNTDIKIYKVLGYLS